MIVVIYGHYSLPFEIWSKMTNTKWLKMTNFIGNGVIGVENGQQRSSQANNFGLFDRKLFVALNDL